MALSHRANALTTPDPTTPILSNNWHRTSNPDGYVNLGVAENSLMHNSLSEHLHKNIALPNKGFTYGDFNKRSRTAIAGFLTKHLKPVQPIEPSHVAVVSGCTSGIEHLAWAFGNPGDLILLGRPYYGAFPNDATLRTGTKLALVSFGGDDPLGSNCVRQYEEEVLRAQERGEKVAALILCHPHNPLGRCYPREVLIQFLKLCQKYQIHLISDEIYALSIFSNNVDIHPPPTPFESVLSIDPTGIIDPSLIHVLWGMSKDFGANGLRLGAIITQHNQDLQTALGPVSLFTSISSLSEHVAANVLEDDVWVEKYIQENQKKLAQHYEHITTWAKDHGIDYTPGVNAGFFLWVDLGSTYIRNFRTTLQQDEVDQVLMDALLEKKVFLASGARFGAEQSGWFRIVFSHEMDYLNEGLRRIIDAIQPAHSVNDLKN